MPELTQDDEGKTATLEGKPVGIVHSVSESGEATIATEPNLADSVKTRLDWEGNEESYNVTTDRIAEITDDEVKLTPD